MIASPVRCRSLLAVLAALALFAGAEAHAAEGFAFHRDHVIGTSLDLWVSADTANDAEAAEVAALVEIERLRLVFSLYDPESELSRLNRATSPVFASPELVEVLRAYEHWKRASGGALSAQVGPLVRLWKDAEKAGAEPDPAALDALVQQSRSPGWTIAADSRTVTRLTPHPLDLNAIAKGTIIQKAARAVRQRVPGVRALALNLGGDLAVWGEPAPGRTHWPVAVQDPFSPFDNARPLAGLLLPGGSAVATSGGYQRFTTINGVRHSHILDPRTGRPATGVASATATAPDNATANALATALCVLTPEEGLRLVAATPGAAALIVTADGRLFRSPGLNEFDLPPVPIATHAAADPWPDGHQVTVGIELPTIANAKKYRKPYVAVWVEDANGKPVRTLAVWGNDPKYLKDLSDWWKFGKGNAPLIAAVTKATRGPGKYSLVWDGKDDAGNPVSQGTYTLKVEVHREHGAHLRQSGKIECGAKPSKATIEKNAESADVTVQYGKK